MTRLRDQLLAHLGPHSFPVVVTGAGISVASGIPTFRGPDEGAVWSNDVLEKATLAYFFRDPVQSWLWYLDRFAKCSDATPNAAHHALRTLADKVPATMVVTQNVDGLHHDAGQSRLIEIHGAARFIRCVRRGCDGGHGPERAWLEAGELDAFKASPSLVTLPRCGKCRKLLRPHVLWFDETYTSHPLYDYNEALNSFMSATVFIVVGTSFSVTIMDVMMQHAGRYDVPVYVIDPHMAEAPTMFIELIREPAETFLPDLVAQLP